MAATKTKSPAKLFKAKVKGEKKWLAHDGTKFYISDKVKEAEEFTADYVKKIASSKWGGKDWEKA